MSCCQPCTPCCQPCGPTPLANSCNECCNTVVGSSTSAAVGSILSCDGVPINSGGFDLSCITSCYGGNRCRPC
ncbi:KRF1 protein, partial [Sapayoa aenigma]|nr:KRF1 protein [Sapayoa aenigma]